MTTERPPLLTLDVLDVLRDATTRGDVTARVSLDLGRSVEDCGVGPDGFVRRDRSYPWPEPPRERTILHWDGTGFTPVQRWDGGLYKLVATPWGTPTFEIDGIKMLPTARVSPWDDAAAKVALVDVRGRALLDTCGGLGYFAAHALAAGAQTVTSFEKSSAVLWLRTLNPWSPQIEEAAHLQLHHADVSDAVRGLPDASFGAALHDPPRFGIAGELYSLAFYRELFRVLAPGARLFHYTGTPNARTSGRDVPAEVSRRLAAAGFTVEFALDGVLARKDAVRRPRRSRA
jgi:predicted methyltransferase